MTDKRDGWQPVDLALIAVFAALIAAFSLIPPIPVGSVGVPITLQTLGVALTGLVLGPWRGFLATALYLVVGFAGLPVFAGGGATLAVLGKPSAGYLLSFPLAALIAGLLSRWFLSRGWRFQYLWLFVSGFAASIVVVHPLGIVGMMVNAQLPLAAAAAADIVYWPGDIAKNLVAATVAVAVLKAFPRLTWDPLVAPTGAAR